MSFLFYVFLENMKLCGMDEFCYSVMTMSCWYCFVLSCVFDCLNQYLEGIKGGKKAVMILFKLFSFSIGFFILFLGIL